ncbi:MAG TPA: hypothetical protein VHX88_08735 [Solirubrobacteraceae bacterium]|jgi:predicted lipoprotein with Yx(FWY)xxD motif|nr:hypothetical protein [Solirubrobacteraceae bacterium]
MNKRLIPLVLPLAAVGAGAAVVAGTASTAVAKSSSTVISTRHTSLGTFLVGPNGHALYLFAKDKTSTVTCTGACAKVWPPLTGTPKAGKGVNSKLLGVTKTHVITYKGHPLYYYITDTKAGQVTGQHVDSFGAEWYVVSPSGSAITKG